MNNNTFTLELDLDQAMAVSQSLSKSLAAEHAKIKRNGKGNPISQKAARNWQLIDSVLADLHEELGSLVSEFD